MADQINVWIVTEAQGPHLEAYLSSLATADGVELVALADSSEKSFEQARAIFDRSSSLFRTFRDEREMLQTAHPKLTVVTPPAYQAPVPIELALDRGSHVIAEKPACVNVSDFQKLVRLADSKHLHLMLPLANRVNSHVKQARDLVATGMLGQLYGTTLYTIGDQTRLTRKEFQQSWLASKAKSGGGYLLWLGIHWIDAVQMVSGQNIQQVCGMARNVGGQPIEVEGAAVLALEFDNGMVGTLHSGYYLDKGFQNQCSWLRFDVTAESLLEWYSSRPEAPKGVQTIRVTRPANPYAPFVQAAVNCARGTEAAPITTAKVSLFSKSSLLSMMPQRREPSRRSHDETSKERVVAKPNDSRHP
jgi:predicted dehydrogenase